MIIKEVTFIGTEWEYEGKEQNVKVDDKVKLVLSDCQVIGKVIEMDEIELTIEIEKYFTYDDNDNLIESPMFETTETFPWNYIYGIEQAKTEIGIGHIIHAMQMHQFGHDEIMAMREAMITGNFDNIKFVADCYTADWEDNDRIKN